MRNTAGGGGERVLWTAIQAIQEKRKNTIIVLYTAFSNGEDKNTMLKQVEEKFGLVPNPKSIHVEKLERLGYVNREYSRMRLLFQSIGSILLCIEAMIKFVPDIYIDTLGYAFTYPFVKIFCKIPVVSYTHYPTISSDMRQAVASRESGVCNDEVINKSSILSAAKRMYYTIIFWAYSFAGSSADVVMANSTWTYNHIRKTFVGCEFINVVYPPCDTDGLVKFNLKGKISGSGKVIPRERKIISLAQFRPEKNQSLQIESFAKFLENCPEFKISKENENQKENDSSVKLIIMGGARNSADMERVEKLKLLSKQLDVSDQVEFIVNASYPEICDQLQTAICGLHTMKDEHFGINIVEFMASGAIPIAHKSAGPMMDIVVPYISPTPELKSAGVNQHEKDDESSGIRGGINSTTEDLTFLNGNFVGNLKKVNSELLTLQLEEARKSHIRESKLDKSGHNESGKSSDLAKAFPVGFLAITSSEFANAFECVFKLDSNVLNNMQIAGRNRAVNTFSSENFKEEFLKSLDQIHF
ncbi:hypothetical protein BB558_004263 [Smittium angustum]|uniref:GDP-Man:Man(3)GlcNAc(2)-PP-Dol alpha-1,2-mannosyltransferase n=1 Tax=Smittium angustum TaxID=133377 RepID=A0A2U1J3S9_SMIAN|nr:hypothetical protein BB558_004263 [Smittium angustum]